MLEKALQLGTLHKLRCMTKSQNLEGSMKGTSVSNVVNMILGDYPGIQIHFWTREPQLGRKCNTVSVISPSKSTPPRSKSSFFGSFLRWECYWRKDFSLRIRFLRHRSSDRPSSATFLRHYRVLGFAVAFYLFLN